MQAAIPQRKSSHYEKNPSSLNDITVKEIDDFITQNQPFKNMTIEDTGANQKSEDEMDSMLQPTFQKNILVDDEAYIQARMELSPKRQRPDE